MRAGGFYCSWGTSGEWCGEGLVNFRSAFPNHQSSDDSAKISHRREKPADSITFSALMEFSSGLIRFELEYDFESDGPACGIGIAF